MVCRSLSCCKNCWDFHPRQPWPVGLPVFCWGNQRLTGFEREQGEGLDLSEGSGSLVEVFVGCYPKLSLPEIARLWSAVARSSEQGNEWRKHLPELVQHYGLRWNDELQKTMEVLVQLPLEFQKWCSDKQLGTRDLAPIRALKDLQLAKNLWPSLALSGLSKSQGVQVLEWAIDLLLMGKSWEQIKPLFDPPEAKWLNQLKELRYPQTHSADKDKQFKTAQLPWPARTQAQWVRQGDRGFLEVRLQADSLEDFRHKLTGLAKVEKALKGEGLLWEK